MKPELKAPGTNLLTLQYDASLSTFAFNFNLRRYSVALVLRRLRRICREVYGRTLGFRV